MKNFNDSITEQQIALSISINYPFRQLGEREWVAKRVWVVLKAEKFETI